MQVREFFDASSRKLRVKFVNFSMQVRVNFVSAPAKFTCEGRKKFERKGVFFAKGEKHVNERARMRRTIFLKISRRKTFERKAFCTNKRRKIREFFDASSHQRKLYTKGERKDDFFENKPAKNFWTNKRRKTLQVRREQDVKFAQTLHKNVNTHTHTHTHTHVCGCNIVVV